MSSVSLKERVSHALDSLSEMELQQVADYLAFLRFRARVAPSPNNIDLAALYAEAATEDRQLAEVGMDDYHSDLQTEDRL